MKGDRWMTKSGVVVIERQRKETRLGTRVLCHHESTGGRHGWLALERLLALADGVRCEACGCVTLDLGGHRTRCAGRRAP